MKPNTTSSFSMDGLQEECLSEYRIDRHVLGLETQQERRHTELHILDCTGCYHAVREIQKEHADFVSLEAPLPHALEEAIKTVSRDAVYAETQKETERQAIPGWFQRWLHNWTATLAVAVAACAVLALPQVLQPLSNIPRIDADVGVPYVGFKGSTQPRLLVALQRKGTIRLARMGEPFRHLDSIRIACEWRSENPGYVFIFHRDLSSTWTPLYPSDPEKKSVPLSMGRVHDLPGSLEVDDASHGREEIWACFSKKPLSRDVVQRAIPPLHRTVEWRTQPREACDALVVFYFTRKE